MPLPVLQLTCVAIPYTCEDCPRLYSFQDMFLEPMSHTILNGLLRAFLTLICNTSNGIVVNGEEFHLTTEVQNRMDGIIKRLQFPSAFNRPAVLLNSTCATQLIMCGIALNILGCSVFRLQA